jgi:hypothetical protein
MKKLLLVLSIAFTFYGITNAQLSKFQAMYIYNFSRMVEWPEDYKSGTFEIGIIGNNSLMQELKTFTSNKKAGTQNISVVNFNNIDDVKKCHILFVGGNMEKKFSEIYSKINGHNVLVISEKTNLVGEGAAISFTIIDGKLKYYLNADNAKNKGLKVSSSLKNMALADK